MITQSVNNWLIKSALSLFKEKKGDIFYLNVLETKLIVEEKDHSHLRKSNRKIPF